MKPITKGTGRKPWSKHDKRFTLSVPLVIKVSNIKSKVKKKRVIVKLGIAEPIKGVPDLRLTFTALTEEELYTMACNAVVYLYYYHKRRNPTTLFPKFKKWITIKK